MERVIPDASYQNILSAPAGMNAELVDGALHLHPAGDGHAPILDALSQTYADRREWLSEECPWFADSGLHLQFGNDFLLPAAAAWLDRDRLHRPQTKRAPGYRIPAGASPEWVLELMTPETLEFIREKKLPIYLRGGVRVAWLLDPKERRCEVLVADQGEWRRHQLFGDHGRMCLWPFECEEVDLDCLWDTPEQQRQKLEAKVEGLARALDDAVARGVDEEALFTLLLKTMDVEVTPWEDEVVAPLLRSHSILLRARVLVACRVPIRHARRVAIEELSEMRYLNTLQPDEAEALGVKYCELVDHEGQGSVSAGGLRLRAQVWARHRLGCGSHSRSDHEQSPNEQERSLAGAQLLDAYAQNRMLSDPVRTVVINGPGAWRASSDAWNEATAAVINELEEPSLVGEERLVDVTHELSAHLRKRNPVIVPPPIEWTDSDPGLDSIFDSLEPLFSDPPARPILEDIALEWRLVKRELACEMAEFRQTEHLPPALRARLISGHGLSLLTEEERASLERA